MDKSCARFEASPAPKGNGFWNKVSDRSAAEDLPLLRDGVDTPGGARQPLGSSRLL
jgi:hypothetical protein